MRMVGLFVWIAGMVSLGHGSDAKNGGLLAKVKTKSVVSFRVSGVRLIDVASKLSYASDIGICAEEVVALCDVRGNPGLSGVKTFSFEMEKATVEQVLDEVIGQDDRYIWEVDEGHNLVNIGPREGGTLNWPVDLGLENKTLREVFIDEGLLGLREHGVRFLYGHDEYLEHRVSEMRGVVSVRVALNSLFGPLGLMWHLYQGQHGEGCILEIDSYHRWETVGG